MPDATTHKKKCPVCQNHILVVIDSRTVDDGATRRRRQCTTCGHRWSTYEVGSEDYKMLLKIRAQRKEAASVRVSNHGFKPRYIVPDAKQEEYRLYKAKGYRVDEIATMMRLERNG